MPARKGQAVSDYDLLVVGHETEGCLAAVAAARAGARTALLAPHDALMGGLLTEDGLAFVDRDSRHLTPPEASPGDGIFAEFLARAGVPLVALPASDGDQTLRKLMAEAGVALLAGETSGARVAHGRLEAVTLAGGGELAARHYLDATPDADLAEQAGLRFATGFREYGIDRCLGVSPLPLVTGVTPAQIMSTCQALQADPTLDALRQRLFPGRAFLELENGDDYVLIGPPHLGLAYQRWREAQGLADGAFVFEADGFNVATLGPETTSWNGLIYFSEDPATLLRLSREGADAYFREEAARFGRFLRDGLGWRDAEVTLPRGIYVRQTRHALDTRHRLTLDELASGYDRRSVGTFCYYPDFRGFRAVKVPGPITAHVALEAGLAAHVRNLGLACRAGGYTPFAHSLCRLVQYNVTLGAALGVAAAMAGDDLGEIDVQDLRTELSKQAALADDRTGLDKNPAVLQALQADPVIALEGSLA